MPGHEGKKLGVSMGTALFRHHSSKCKKKKKKIESRILLFSNFSTARAHCQPFKKILECKSNNTTYEPLDFPSICLSVSCSYQSDSFQSSMFLLLFHFFIFSIYLSIYHILPFYFFLPFCLCDYPSIFFSFTLYI